MSWQADWEEVNRQMIAKSLGELSYEQILKPGLIRHPEAQARHPEAAPRDLSPLGRYSLALSSGITYEFEAWESLWTDLKVNKNSITRNGATVTSAGQFFIDCQKETAMDDIILANFLEEMHNTLYADLALLNRNRRVTSEELSTWSGEKVQTVLKGHPKLLQNKGRIGWSAEDHALFGPEHERPVQFHWVAVKKTNCLSGIDSSLTWQSVFEETMTEDDVFWALLEKNQLSPDEYFFVPVHPWQWDRYVKIQYGTALASGEMRYLGAFGDLYLPQISLRTFSNISRPEKMDIKLPITILNTSAIRGIPGKYMKQGPALSAKLKEICAADKNLSGVTVLAELAGVSVTHSLYSQVKQAPYRYHELLGVLWRQSSQSFLKANEVALIAGSFFHQDPQGKSLIGAHIKQSGLETSAWLEQYFKNVFLPLYHLQAKYGIGLVAHGQNVVVRLANSTPVGIFLKDFQGDLRVSEGSNALEGFDLTRLPRHYLIHDLLTGHLVTVLRFISETLQECDRFPEVKFYQILGQTLQGYLAQNPEIRDLKHFKDIDLLQETFHRVLVNKVRFKIGYADSAERPVPMLGEDLVNPIFRALSEVLRGN